MLRDGRIIEQGTHDALVENDVYARMYRMNYASFDDISSDELDAKVAQEAAGTT